MWWSLLCSSSRPAREDAILQAGLPGYAACTGKTRFRLVPGLW
jgi:hypothetical protein